MLPRNAMRELAQSRGTVLRRVASAIVVAALAAACTASEEPEEAPPFSGAWTGYVDSDSPRGYSIRRLTLAFDANHRLGFLNCVIEHSFGELPYEFPQSGSRPVVRGPKFVFHWDNVVVEEASWQPPTFKFRFHATGQSTDIVESIEGTMRGDRLAVEYSFKGKLWGADTDVQLKGLLRQ